MSNQSSDIPEGFKITEIGPLPVEWHTMPFDYLMKPRSETMIPGDMPDMRYVGLEHMDSGETKIRRWGNAQQVRSAKSRFYPNDILYGKLRPYLDKAAVAEWEGMCSTDILVFSAYDDRAIPAYLAHSMHTKPFLDHAVATTSGVNHPRTSWGSISRFTTACPPLSEQKAIAGVLSIIQKAIEAQDKVITAARETKRSLMRHLFTYGPVPVAEAGKVPLKETEIGRVPEHWEVVRLEAVKAPHKGAIASGPFGSSIGKRFFVPSGVPVIRGNNLTTGRIRFVDDGFVYLTEDKASEFSYCEAISGDVVFTAAGTIGQVGIVPENARFKKYIISNKQMRIRLSLERTLPDFVYYWFTSSTGQSEIVSQQRGTSIPVINLSILRNLLLPLPPLPTQHEIVFMLSAEDKKTEAEDRRKASLQALLRTMLHHLMTGKVRVKDLEVTPA